MLKQILTVAVVALVAASLCYLNQQFPASNDKPIMLRLHSTKDDVWERITLPTPATFNHMVVNAPHHCERQLLRDGKPVYWYSFMRRATLTSWHRYEYRFRSCEGQVYIYPRTAKVVASEIFHGLLTLVPLVVLLLICAI